MATVITQAMVSAPGGYVLPAWGDYYLAEDLVYSHSVGQVISGSPGGRVRIYGNGRSIMGIGGHSQTADGISLTDTPLEVYDLNIQNFRTNIRSASSLTTYGHIQSNIVCNVTSVGATQRAITLAGTGNIAKNLMITHTGNGGVAYRPIGMESFGPNPMLIDVTVLNMLKGPNDTETMHYHIQDAGNSGIMVNCHGINPVANPLSFGIWWNSTQRMDVANGQFKGLTIVFAGDLDAGRISGPAPLNYQSLIGWPPTHPPVLAFF